MKSRKWNHDDYRLAEQLRGKVSRKNYTWIRNHVRPLPGRTTVDEKIGFLSIREPGFLHPILKQLAHKQHDPSWTEKDFLTVATFDEFHLQNIAELDMKIEAIIGRIK